MFNVYRSRRLFYLVRCWSTITCVRNTIIHWFLHRIQQTNVVLFSRTFIFRVQLGSSYLVLKRFECSVSFTRDNTFPKEYFKLISIVLNNLHFFHGYNSHFVVINCISAVTIVIRHPITQFLCTFSMTSTYLLIKTLCRNM